MSANPTRVAELVDRLADAADECAFITMDDIIAAAFRYAFLVSSGFIECAPDAGAARAHVTERAAVLVQQLMHERPIDGGLVPPARLKAPVQELRRVRARRRQEES
jgi:hypothetical protein